MKTASEARQKERIQTHRENSMTWQEIRDDSIIKLKDLVTSVSSGIIEKEIQAERFAVCEDCSEFRKSLRQCKVCSCYMPAKTLFKRSKCPKGYWNK
jgi:hypothetical protein